MVDRRPPPTGGWQDATVLEVTRETARANTIRLALAQPFDHLAGQHVVVRLTAPDGYTAARSYSIASPPDGSATIELTVERLDGGEVSTFLHDDLEVGDTIEIRGPIGGWFVWWGDEPAVLIGGGSGLVPLVAMLRLARATAAEDRLRLLASVRSPDDLLYAGELLGDGGAGSERVRVAFTRTAPAGSDRPPGRLSRTDLAELLDGTGADATVFVCGSAGFADHVTGLLADVAVPVERVRVERFGPSA